MESGGSAQGRTRQAPSETSECQLQRPHGFSQIKGHLARLEHFTANFRSPR